jgi:hypothetical protein
VSQGDGARGEAEAHRKSKPYHASEADGGTVGNLRHDSRTKGQSE